MIKSTIVIFSLLLLLLTSCGTPRHKEFGKQNQNTQTVRLNKDSVQRIHSYNVVQYDSIDKRWYFIEHVEFIDTIRSEESNAGGIEFIGPRLTPNGFEVLPGEPGISFD